MALVGLLVLSALVIALAALSGTDPVVAGNHYRAAAARAPGRVVMTGFVPPDRMPEMYLLGDVFVGPSQNQEGLGMVFLEAAAAGLPVIATALGGIPEAVQDGVNGLLLRRPDDAADLAEKILLLLQNPDLRRRLGRRGREEVCRNFSWEKIARDQEEFYDMVWGQGGRGPRDPSPSPPQLPFSAGRDVA